MEESDSSGETHNELGGLVSENQTNLNNPPELFAKLPLLSPSAETPIALSERHCFARWKFSVAELLFDWHT